jgi:hypothetical protein
MTENVSSLALYKKILSNLQKSKKAPGAGWGGANISIKEETHDHNENPKFVYSKSPATKVIRLPCYTPITMQQTPA